MYKSGGIIIRHSTVKVLDERDMEFIEALRSLDVPRCVASLITYLANVSGATSKEIETATRMNQPEVSIAMRTLHQNNWIEEGDIKEEGKGRPMKVYMLSVPIEEIIKHYEDVKNSEAAKTMQAIQRLKDITAT
jgi:predicted transcriptional regulator